ncbi:MAG: IPTL-CTERM sorting domain-containing protein [Candidatus Zixiibacteriota bacterium]|nr:MAG: IPTL-CTERM sorting domain-containing protein [candidate division Zixibacteria bacterium]
MRKLATVFLMVLLLAIAGTINAQIAFYEEHQKQMAMTNLLSMPLAFTENQGQFGEKTLFKANAVGATFYFYQNEVAYFFVRDTDELLKDDAMGRRDFSKMPDDPDRPGHKKESMLIKAQFVGANPDLMVIGVDRLAHNNSYFHGNDPSKWHTDVPNNSAILYKDIYPGIDLKYYGDGRSMKYDFIVRPSADVSQIRIHYDGVDNLNVTPGGNLQARTRFGLIHEKKPYVYQEINGERLEVNGRYTIIEPGIFGFDIENGLNPDYPLIIDPELLYSTYLGGGSTELAYGIAIDYDGNAYITGYTSSIDFPLQDPLEGTFNGGTYDAFVTKVSATGDALIYSTYLGGNGQDIGRGIAVDADGNAYIIGYTQSGNFPLVNPVDSTFDGGPTDAFVSKFSAAGDSLIFSTYLGGTGFEQAGKIDVDINKNVYVTGYTSSSDFPLQNPYDGTFNGGTNDAYVTKFSASGDSLVYSTYLGGNDDDVGANIIVYGEYAYVIGATYSNNLPAINSIDSSYNGNEDTFVTKFAPSGNSLIFSTYLGGTNDDSGYSIDVDGDGNAYITGFTNSIDFPTVNPYDSDHNGNWDVFVSKISVLGDSLIYSTYVGGGDYDGAWDIAVGGSGNAYVTGWTQSIDFPMWNAYDSSFNADYDAFVFVLTVNGENLLNSTYFGGNVGDYGNGIAVDSAGNVYIAGGTSSGDFPTHNAYDTSYNYNGDVFIAKFYPVVEPIPTLSEWGMLIMALLILAIGTVAVVRRKRAVVKT